MRPNADIFVPASIQQRHSDPSLHRSTIGTLDPNAPVFIPVTSRPPPAAFAPALTTWARHPAESPMNVMCYMPFTRDRQPQHALARPPAKSVNDAVVDYAPASACPPPAERVQFKNKMASLKMKSRPPPVVRPAQVELPPARPSRRLWPNAADHRPDNDGNWRRAAGRKPADAEVSPKRQAPQTDYYIEDVEEQEGVHYESLYSDEDHKYEPRKPSKHRAHKPKSQRRRKEKPPPVTRPATPPPEVAIPPPSEPPIEEPAPEHPTADAWRQFRRTQLKASLTDTTAMVIPESVCFVRQQPLPRPFLKDEPLTQPSDPPLMPARDRPVAFTTPFTWPVRHPSYLCPPPDFKPIVPDEVPPPPPPMQDSPKEEARECADVEMSTPEHGPPDVEGLDAKADNVHGGPSMEETGAEDELSLRTASDKGEGSQPSAHEQAVLETSDLSIASAPAAEVVEAAQQEEILTLPPDEPAAAEEEPPVAPERDEAVEVKSDKEETAESPLDDDAQSAKEQTKSDPREASEVIEDGAEETEQKAATEGAAEQEVAVEKSGEDTVAQSAVGDAQEAPPIRKKVMPAGLPSVSIRKFGVPRTTLAGLDEVDGAPSAAAEAPVRRMEPAVSMAAPKVQPEAEDGKWPSACMHMESGKIVWLREALLSVRGFPSCNVKPDAPLLKDIMHDGSQRRTVQYLSSWRPASGSSMSSSFRGNRIGGVFQDDLWDKSDIMGLPLKKSLMHDSLHRRYDTSRYKSHANDQKKGGGSEEGMWRSAEKREIKIDLPESAWAIQQQREKVSGDQSKMMVRRLRGQLNKMTVETFEQIYSGLMDMIKTASEAKQLIHLIFEKATTQHTYVKMYADLTVRLDSDFREQKLFEATKEEGAPVEDFRHIILQACQASFEANLLGTLETPEGASEEELFELLMKYKLRMKGNLKFIGELLMRGMMIPRVGFNILDSLLDHGGEHQLEALATFMSTVGGYYERNVLLKEKIHQQYHIYLERVAEVANDPDVSNRVSCLLKDVLEGRSISEDPTASSVVKHRRLSDI